MAYEVDFLPVGENTKSGDAILVRFWDTYTETEKDQKICLIDGGFCENGPKIEEHLKNYYNSNHINIVISTHPDQDHINGLQYILENIEVDELWIHRPWLYTEDMAKAFKDGRITDNSLARNLQATLNKAYELEKIAKDKGIKIKDPFTGLSAYNDTIRVLGPTKEYYKELMKDFHNMPAPVESANESFLEKALKVATKLVKAIWGKDNLEKNPETSAENNSSVITLLNFVYDNDKFLLTADAGVPALDMAADALKNFGLETDCTNNIQIPHHGSKHNVNSEVLNRLVGKIVDKNSNPKKLGIVSISKESDEKHPSKAVLNAFKQRGVNIAKTNGSNVCFNKGTVDREGYKTADTYEFFEEVEEV